MKKIVSVFGMFRDSKETNRASGELKKFGIHSSIIKTIHPTDDNPFIENDENQILPNESFSQIRKGSIIGAIAGFIIIGLTSMILGGHRYPMIILIAGPLGGLAGAAFGALVGIGTPMTAGRRYGKYLKTGSSLLAVNIGLPKQKKMIRNAMTEVGGQDVTVLNESAAIESVIIEQRISDKDL